MKWRRSIVKFVIPLLIVAAGAVWSVWRQGHPRPLPPDRCSDDYRRYYKEEGIQASFLMHFTLGDSLTVPVTILTATDSASWARLSRDFHIVLPPDCESQPDIMIPLVFAHLSPKGHYDLPMDTTAIEHNNYILATPQNHTVYVFQIDDGRQIDAIMMYKLRESLLTIEK